MRRVLAAIALVSLTGCTPSLAPVEALRPVPDGWTDRARLPAPEVEDRWWQAFDDPVLNALVARADLADDPAIAEARMIEALSGLASARAGLRPRLTAAVTGEARHIDDLEQDQIAALALPGWSPDLNGAQTARRRAAQARLSSATVRAAAVRQTTRATVVRLYIAWHEGQARAAAGDRSVSALSTSLDLSASRERAGLISSLDPVAVRVRLAAARAAPLAAREAAETARLGLEALLGLAPGTLVEVLKTGPSSLPVPPAFDPVLTPAAVLARRPDLLAAGLDLAAAGYESEAARRDFWPTLSLSLMLGGQGVDPVSPFLASGGLIAAGAGLTSPLTSFGRLEGARDTADARRRIAALQYRQVATLALAEVEQALTAAESAERRRRTVLDATEAGQDRLALAASRYRAGLAPLLDVLAAEGDLADGEVALTIARADAARARISLSLAMGLGAGA